MSESFWTEERVEELKRLWAKDEASGAIAAQLGTTRSAVIGKARRLNLEEREARNHYYYAPLDGPKQKTVFKTREHAAPRREHKKAMPRTASVRSVRTGTIFHAVRVATGPEPSKSELRAMLTQAVLNTK